MKRITIVAPAGAGNNLSSIVGPYKIFLKAEEHWRRQGRRPVARVEVAGTTASVDYFDGLFSVNPQTHVSDIDSTDLVLIPSVNHQFREAIDNNKPLLDWLTKQYRQGAEIASMCTGGFLLAATGLIDGMQCSVHWSAADDFRMLFPRVQLQADKLITEEHGIYTNGGAYSFLNLVLHLVEKYYDRETAVWCAKVFQVDMERNSQAPFASFTSMKTHGDTIVEQAQEYIERNVDERISVDSLCARFHTGRRNFDRRFFRATGKTPIEYAQRVKVEAAKKALETNRKTVNEVMYEVGYSDVKAFRELFRRITGLSPLEYKARYYRGR